MKERVNKETNIIFRITKEDKEFIKQLAEHKGITVAKLIRESIRQLKESGTWKKKL